MLWARRAEGMKGMEGGKSGVWDNGWLAGGRAVGWRAVRADSPQQPHLSLTGAPILPTQVLRWIILISSPQLPRGRWKTGRQDEWQTVNWEYCHFAYSSGHFFPFYFLPSHLVIMLLKMSEIIKLVRKPTKELGKLGCIHYSAFPSTPITNTTEWFSAVNNFPDSFSWGQSVCFPIGGLSRSQ